jgi:hypothetical protein
MSRVGCQVARIVALATGAMLVAASSDAHAQTAVGLDTSGVVHDTRDRGFAEEVDLRVGYRFGLSRHAIIDRTLVGAVIFQVEAIGGIRHSPIPVSSGANPDMGRIGGGVRIGFTEPTWLTCGRWEPFFFFHYTGAFSGESAAGLWDLGAAFEWRFPAASLGLHATVDHLMGGGGWIEVGPHVEFRFLP